MKLLGNFLRLSFVIVYLTLIICLALSCIDKTGKVRWNTSDGATLKGTMIKVAVIDTGVDITDARFKGKICEGSKDFTGTGLKDTVGHGTHVAGTIIKYAGSKVNYCLLILKFYSPIASGRVNFERSLEAIKYAGEQRANLINYSAGGPDRQPEEAEAIKALPWALFIVAAGNNGIDAVEGRDPTSENGAKGYFPAAYGLPNVIAVGSLDIDGKRLPTSNFGPAVKVWELGVVESTLPGGKRGILRGTSMATAVFTGKVLSGDAHEALTR